MTEPTMTEPETTEPDTTQSALQPVPPDTPLAAAAPFRWPLSRIIGSGMLAFGVVVIIACALGTLAVTRVTSAQNLVVGQVAPAIAQSYRLQAALVDQETGVRGYALSGQADFLAPYTAGLASQNDAVGQLQHLVGQLPGVAADLRLVLARTATWRADYAEPTITAVRATNRPDTSSNVVQGKDTFDQIRAAANALQHDLDTNRTTALAALSHATTLLTVVEIAAGVLLLVIVIAAGMLLWAAAIRPVTKVAAQAQQVAGGDFQHHVRASGPREVFELALVVERMRERILRELSALQEAHEALDRQTKELQRSNAELEQFAYVASHDLQEPLRKVASFCQLLQRRYSGQLDERADQYIGFAVDGAKRMQVLINDLLAFSRVGRLVRERQAVPLRLLMDQAIANLAETIERTGAVIEVGELPTVLAEAPLLTAVFQNLLSNALKFTADKPPTVTVTAEPDGERWLVTFADNGIGIQPQYAERIFAIFQRLHGKDAYPGSGIGLAMCRKIVEYHGGTIWLDTTATVGTRFQFTLPIAPEDAAVSARDRTDEGLAATT